MEQVNLYVGAQIRRYRKNRQMTLQQLADRIHKSRASVSKYETGEVSLDIVTLTEIARVLEVQPGQLVDLSFVNRYNPLEEDLLYIFNPLELRDSTDGLLCGISSADLMPCAFKCLVTLHPQEHTEEFKKRLLITRRELQQWQKLNMLMVDNIG